jgi:putative membrane-bound dehydrogenase-like protein
MNRVACLAPLVLLTAALPCLAYKPGDPVPKDFKMPPPLSLEEAVASLQTIEGLEVQLVAAEPLTMDPINIDWGPDGRLWVVEMGDYPLGVDNRGAPGGRVRILTDTDRDGVYDKSTLFLDKLAYPTDLKTWRDGVLVTLAGKIIFARDTDGDDKADRVDDLYVEFDDNNPQHLVNGMEWGLDNWLHLATGSGKGSAPRSVKTNKALPTLSADLRIHPDTGGIELLGGRSQYGRVRDNRGSWFGSNNSYPFFQHLLPDRYTKRNPHLAPPSERVQVSDEPFAPRVYPTSVTAARYNNAKSANHITSACSALVYQDGLLKDHLHDQWFICEPVHNLVHRERLSRDGVYHRSSRLPGEKTSDFLTSSDQWFRPTAVKAGPSGALWVVDMHRYVNEHPEWIPEEWMQVIDVRAGHELGRIYRIAPKGRRTPPAPDLQSLPTADLVQTLASPTRWRRDMAHKILIWRHDTSAVAPLIQTVKNHDNPLARLHALSALEGLGRLTADLNAKALSDDDPGVRRLALRFAESRMAETPALVPHVAKRLQDVAPLVRLQAAFTAGATDRSEAGHALADYIQRYGDDRILRAAAMSSALPHLNVLLEDVLDADPLPTDAAANLIATAVATKQPDALRAVLHSIVTHEIASGATAARTPRLTALMRTLQKRGLNLEQLNKTNDSAIAQHLRAIAGIVDDARQRAKAPDATEADRLRAIPMLGAAKSLYTDIDLLGDWLGDASRPAAQNAAADRLAQIGNSRSYKTLVAAWPAYTPATASRITGLMLSRTNSRNALLAAIENGDLPASAIELAQQRALIDNPSSSISLRAEALFQNAGAPDRLAVIERYQSVLSLTGDVARGREQFALACVACHRLDGIGRNVGPNLAALTDKSPASLLVGILDPNRAIEDKYRLYTPTLRDGRVLAGMISSENANAVTLEGIEGVTHTILRTDLQSLGVPGPSMMPIGLEAALPPQAMADLIAFLQTAETE